MQVRESYNLSHEEITALAAAEPAGARGVTFLPYLDGARTPNWPHARWRNAVGRPSCYSPDHLSIREPKLRTRPTAQRGPLAYVGMAVFVPFAPHSRW